MKGMTGNLKGSKVSASKTGSGAKMNPNAAFGASSAVQKKSVPVGSKQKKSINGC